MLYDIKDKLINRYGENITAILSLSYSTRDLIQEYEEFISDINYTELDFIDYLLTLVKQELIDNIKNIEAPERYLDRHLSLVGDEGQEIY